MRRSRLIALLALALGLLLVALWWLRSPAESALSVRTAPASEGTARGSGPASSTAVTEGAASAEPSAEGGLALFVTAKGTPVEGAQVRLYGSAAPARAEGPWTLLRGRTGADGTVRLSVPPGLYQAFATGPDGREARLVAERPGGEGWTRVELALTSPLPLEGVVVEAAGGAPVPLATVTLTPRLNIRDAQGRPISPEQERRSVQTDVSGRFRLEGLSAGSWRLDVLAAGHAPLYRDRILLPAESPLRLELNGTGFLSGFVQDAAGQPVADARVWAEGTSEAEAVTTGDGGGFSLEVGAGLYRVRARKEGRSAALPRMVTVKAGQTVEDLRLTLQEAPVLAVEVVERGTQKPVGRCTATVRQGAEGHEAHCDAVGRLVVEGLAPGVVTVEVTAPGFAPQKVEGVTLVGSERFALRVELSASATVQGQVTTPAGRPVAGAWVRTGHFWGKGQGQGAVATTTDAEGRYRLEDVPPGEVSVRAWNEPAAMGAAQTVTVAPGETASVDLVLEVSGVLEGRVTRRDGKPLHAETSVTASPRERRTQGRSTPLTVKRDGTYRMELPAGPYNVNAARWGSWEWNMMNDAVPVEVLAGKTVQLDLVVSPEEEKCEVRVLEPGGAPAVRASVRASTTSLMAGDEGTFSWALPESATASVGVRAFKGGRYGEAQVKGCADVVQLQEPARLTGRVRDASGNPVEGFTVSWGFAGETFPWWKKVGSARFGGGQYALDDVPASTLEVQVLTEDGQHGEGRVTLSPGVEGRLDVVVEKAARIEGRVVEARSGRPIVGATVNMNAAGLHPLHTDVDGRFSTEALPPGTYRLFAFADGFGSTHREVVLAKGQVASLGEVKLEEPRVEPGTIGAAVGSRDGRLRLTHVQLGGPADRAGVRDGDGLLAIDEASVTDMTDAAKRLFGAPGSLVRLRLLRGGEELTLEFARQP